MPPTELISTRRHPVGLYISALVFLFVALAGRVAYDQISWANADLVKWRTLDEGEKEAMRDHKAALYYFTANWCGPCKMLKAECFANAKIAEQINENFVPIKIVDRQMEDGKNTERIKDLEEKLHCDSFPSLVTVHWELIDGKSDDIFSYDNPTRSVLRTTTSDYLPEHEGYGSRQDIEDYLTLIQLWNKVQPSRGKVHWRPNAEIWTERTGAAKKQRLLIVLEKRHEASNRVRMRFINNDQCCQFLEKYFDCYLLETSRHGTSDSQADADLARSKFRLKSLPAFILLDRGGREPAVLSGFSSAESLVDFLERATEGNAKAPELKYESYSYYW